MTTKYYALLTNQGAAKFANAAALGTKLQITEMAVGDGDGTLPAPDASRTTLIGEKRRASLNSLSVDAANSSQIIAEQVIPENEGGFWIREIGLFDADGDMVAVANCPETYKPQLQEGSGRTQTVRMILIINSTAAVTLKIDPAVVLATRKYVDENVLTVRQYADQLMADHVAADNPHGQYLQIANALAEIKDAGLVAELLKNLGLGEGSALPVGTPVPWPTATPPAGWLKCNGAAFIASQYPRLALIYPALRLPDLRGEFIRGWDDGRGVDPGRAVLSSQGDAIRNITGKYRETGGTLRGAVFQAYNPEGALTSATQSARNIINTEGMAYTTISNAVTGLAIDASLVVPTAEENRPRSVAFNYIVRAA